MLVLVLELELVSVFLLEPARVSVGVRASVRVGVSVADGHHTALLEPEHKTAAATLATRVLDFKVFRG